MQYTARCHRAVYLISDWETESQSGFLFIIVRGEGLVCLLVLHISPGLFETASVLTFPVFIVVPHSPIPTAAATAAEDIDEK